MGHSESTTFVGIQVREPGGSKNYRGIITSNGRDISRALFFVLWRHVREYQSFGEIMIRTGFCSYREIFQLSVFPAQKGTTLCSPDAYALFTVTSARSRVTTFAVS